MPSTDSPQSCPPRWSTERADRPTYGGAVAAIATKLGTPLMPWQRHVVDVALEIDPATGLLAYRTVVEPGVNLAASLLPGAPLALGIARTTLWERMRRLGLGARTDTEG